MSDSNSGKSAIIKNFQPMPKRFIVWSEQLNDFARAEDGKAYIFDNITLIAEWLNVNHLAYNKIKLIQSTNLFDKDGKEIFEGSIIRAHTAIWVVKQDKGCMCAFNYNIRVVMPLYKLDMEATKNIGHILSNPELMEEKL